MEFLPFPVGARHARPKKIERAALTKQMASSENIFILNIIIIYKEYINSNLGILYIVYSDNLQALRYNCAL